MPKSATIAKIVMYGVSLWLIASFFIASDALDNVTLILAAFSFFYLGAFFAFADANSIVDFWGQESKLSRVLLDPAKGGQGIATGRFIGVCMMLLTLFAFLIFFRHPTSFHITGR